MEVNQWKKMTEVSAFFQKKVDRWEFEPRPKWRCLPQVPFFLSQVERIQPTRYLSLRGPAGPQLPTLSFPLFEEPKLGFWEVVTFIDTDWSCGFYSAVFAGVFSLHSGSQLKERTL
jgi:hypothetical protein